MPSLLSDSEKENIAKVALASLTASPAQGNAEFALRSHMFKLLDKELASVGATLETAEPGVGLRCLRQARSAIALTALAVTPSEKVLHRLVFWAEMPVVLSNDLARESQMKIPPLNDILELTPHARTDAEAADSLCMKLAEAGFADLLEDSDTPAKANRSDNWSLLERAPMGLNRFMVSRGTGVYNARARAVGVSNFGAICRDAAVISGWPVIGAAGLGRSLTP